MRLIYKAFREVASDQPHRNFLSECGAKAIRQVTYGDTRQIIDALTSRLTKLRLASGSRIVILSESRVEWVQMFLAANRVGCIVVPLDPQLNETEWKNCIGHAEPDVIVASSRFEDSLESLQRATPRFQLGLYFGRIEAKLAKWHSFDEWAELSADTPSEPSEHIPNEMRDADEESDVGVIVYTSGTSGHPMAVQIRDESLLTTGKYLAKFVKGRRGETVLSIAPLHHVFGLNGLMSVLPFAGSITLFPSMERETLLDSFGRLRPHFVIAVPALYERVGRAITEKLDKEAPQFIKKYLHKYVEDGSVDSPPFRHIRRLLFRKVHQGFGGRVRAMACGGAPLDNKTNRLFHFLGLPIYQGYGLTESSGMFTTNRPGCNKIGTIGNTYAPGNEIRIERYGDDTVGELCLKGSLVTKGYYRNDQANRRAFDAEGWFHTGDLVRLDEGFLSFVGRKKDVIVTANGKNTSPEEVEKHFSSLNMVQELTVFGLPLSPGSMEEKVHLHIVPDENAIRDKGAEVVCDLIKSQVAVLSEELAVYKRPTSIAFCHEPLPRTSSLKVKKYQLRDQMMRQLKLHHVPSEQDRYDTTKSVGESGRVLDEIRRLLPPDVEVRPESHFTLDLGLDSLALMELWTKLEIMLNISIASEEVSRWRRVQDVLRYLDAQSVPQKRVSSHENSIRTVSTSE